MKKPGFQGEVYESQSSCGKNKIQSVIFKNDVTCELKCKNGSNEYLERFFFLPFQALNMKHSTVSMACCSQACCRFQKERVGIYSIIKFTKFSRRIKLRVRLMFLATSDLSPAFNNSVIPCRLGSFTSNQRSSYERSSRRNATKSMNDK